MLVERFFIISSSFKLSLRSDDFVFVHFVHKLQVNWLHALDDLLHLRLGVSRLIKFVMSKFSVSNNIDNNVFMESLSVI